MALFGGLWDVVIAIFLVLVFAEYVKVRAKVSKQFNWLAAGGLLVLLAAASPWIVNIAGSTAVSWLETVFSGIGWIVVLVGSLWGAVELLRAK